MAYMIELLQTNRTMLVGKLTDEAKDLAVLVGDVSDVEALTDFQLQEVHDELLVYSYDELEKRFPVYVYGFMDANEGKFVFTTEKPEHIPEDLLTVYTISRNSPITAPLFNMLDRKSAFGQKNVEVDFQSMTSQLSPQKQRSQIKAVRKELLHTFEKYNDLLDDDPQKDELANELNHQMSYVREQFSTPLTMLALAAEDSHQRLFLGEAGTNGEKTSKVVAGLLNFAEDGQLQVLAAPTKADETKALADGGTSEALALVLQEDYQETTGEYANEYIQDLVVRTFSPLATIDEDINVEQEAEKYNSYIDLYATAQSAFMEVAKPIIEQLLGAYLFFQQYNDTVSGRNGMRPALLVTNNDPELLSMSRYLPRLQTYLASVNNTNDFDNVIWNAIVNGVSMNPADDEKKVKEVFKTKKETRRRKDVCSIDTLALLADTFATYNTRLFFSFSTGEETGFEHVAKYGIQPFVDRVTPLMNKEYSSYLVPCLPNPCLIPRNQSAVNIAPRLIADGDDVQESAAREDMVRFFLNGIWIPAAFIATGIVGAYQAPEYQRERFAGTRAKINSMLPGVRFDIEAGDNAKHVTTTLNRETHGFVKSVKDEINRNSFGFILSSEKLILKGRPIDKLTVMKARSLGFDGKQYEPVYQTLVANYFERVFRQQTSDQKEDSINFFISANPQSQMSKWKAESDKLNAIIQPHDQIDFVINQDSDEIILDFKFGAVQRNMRARFQRSSVRNTAS